MEIHLEVRAIDYVRQKMSLDWFRLDRRGTRSDASSRGHTDQMSSMRFARALSSAPGFRMVSVPPGLSPTMSRLGHLSWTKNIGEKVVEGGTRALSIRR